MIGDVLKRLRKEKGLTQEQLAAKVGLSKSAIIQYENNKREPKFLALVKISDFFGVSAQYLNGNSDFKKVSEDIFWNSATRINKQLYDSHPDVFKMIFLIYGKFNDIIDNIITHENPLQEIHDSSFNIDNYIKLSIIQSLLNTINSIYFLKYNFLVVNTQNDQLLSELDFYKRLEKEFKDSLKIIENDLYEIFTIRCKEIYNQYTSKLEINNKGYEDFLKELLSTINPEKYVFSKFIKDFIESKV